MRLIDAESLKGKIREYHAGLFPRSLAKLTDAMYFDIIDIVEEQPTIDAAPVVHARWEEDRMDYRCPACGTVFKDEIAFIYRDKDGMPARCPECGAYMDGGEM